MFLLRTPLWLTIGALGAVACTETPTTLVALDTDLVSPLKLVAPMITDADLVEVVHNELGAPEGPALVDAPTEFSGATTMIFDPGTGVSFQPGFGAALGRHDYIGNVGRVRTTAHVAFEDQHLGSQTAERQDFTPFLLDMGKVKNIWIQARVYTDHTCGLSVQGDSKHWASWQFFQGKDVSSWGNSSITSQRGPSHQGECGRRVSEGDPTGRDALPKGYTCTYLITYDLDTGEIVNVERLFCSTNGERF